MTINRRMLTVEDANSVLCHFSKGFVDYYELDTRLLSDNKIFAYDFITVILTEDSIQFKIANSLWTGGYHISASNIVSPTVSADNNVISVTGTGLEWCVLILELSPEFTHSSHFDLAFYPEFLPVIRPFYESIDLAMGFMDIDTGAGVSGLTISDLIKSTSLTTDGNGLVAVNSGIDKAGDYDYKLGATNNSVSVTYNYPYQRLKAELPVRLRNTNIYREKLNTIEFEFLYDNSYLITSDMLFTGNDLKLIVDNVEYSVNSYSGKKFRFLVPVGDTNYCNMRLKIGGNAYLDKYDLEFVHSVTVVTCSTANQLKTELESSDCAGIVVFSGTELNTSIEVTKDVLVRFSSVVSSTSDVVFTVKDGATLSLADSNFNGKSLVELDDGNLIIENCTLQHCTDTVIKGTGTLDVDNCSFIDNLSAIDVKGTVNVVNTLFDLSDVSYLDTESVAFVHVYNDVTIDFCEFNLDLTGLTSLGLGYVLLYLGADCTINGVKSDKLMVNESFPVRKNLSDVNVESTHYHIYSKNNKCMIWTIEGYNTVYSNQMGVEDV